jgi:hypothetical protein
MDGWMMMMMMMMMMPQDTTSPSAKRELVSHTSVVLEVLLVLGLFVSIGIWAMHA